MLWTVFAMGSGDSPQRSAVAAGAGACIYVVDEAGGPQGAKSDGRVWRRDSDRAVIRRHGRREG